MVVQHLEEGLVVMDAASGVLQWNPAALRMHGVSSPDEWTLGMKGLAETFELYTPDGALVPLENWPLARVVRGEVLHDVELRVRRPMEQWERFIAYSGCIVNDVNGRSLAFVTTRDVTERKHFEEALIEASEFSQQIIAGAGEGILVLDADLRYRVFNPVMEQLMGIPSSEVIGRPVADVLPPQMELDTLSRLNRALQGEVVHSADTFVSATPTSPNRWISSKDAPLRNARGEVVGVIVIVNEITNRKLSEESLQKTVTELANAQRIAKMGSWEWDVPLNRLRWSEQIFQIFGIVPDEFGGNYEAFLSRLHPDDQPAMEHAKSAVLAGGEGLDIETRIVLPNGSIKVLHVLGDPARDDAGNVLTLSGTALDITERTRAEEAVREARDHLEMKVAERTVELEAARRQAESADRLKSAFLATMSQRTQDAIEFDHRLYRHHPSEPGWTVKPGTVQAAKDGARQRAALARTD
jgi:PAS domain S-box-containing protein